MKFSVIIPTYNDWDRLMRCLDALQRQTMDKGQFEVIVVDNSKMGKVPEEITLPDGITLIHEPERGSYSARNTGAGRATGEKLAFTDADCIPDKNWLARAEDCFKQSDCELLGGKIQIFQDDKKNKYGYLYERITAFPQHENVPAGKGVTANLFVEKAVFDALGGFDSVLKSGGDWDFTIRCVDKGYEMIYCENVQVLHPARTLAGIFEKQKRLTCGGALYVKKKYGHGYLRSLGSHVIHGPGLRENASDKISEDRRTFIYLIDILKYLYIMALYGGLILRLINPNKERE